MRDVLGDGMRAALTPSRPVPSRPLTRLRLRARRTAATQTWLILSNSRLIFCFSFPLRRVDRPSAALTPYWNAALCMRERAAKALTASVR